MDSMHFSKPHVTLQQHLTATCQQRLRAYIQVALQAFQQLEYLNMMKAGSQSLVKAHRLEAPAARELQGK